MSGAQPTWVGRTIGDRYQIESLLGRGGMSSVYKATDPNLQRSVAVKIIHPHLSEHPEFVKRFEQEAAAVAQLRHPNIIQVHDFHHDLGVYYMILEFVPGETLEARLAALKLANIRMPLEDTIRTLTILCDAAAYAHDHGMIHRDLKPSNVIMNLLGQPILMDFGIAKIVGSSHVQTATGATIGTAAYMSPEQVLGERVDHRADIYSLGAMLFEMSSGKPPFEGKSSLTVMMKHVNEPIPDIRIINSNIPDVLAGILEKALAKHPEERFASAVEMADALRLIVPPRSTSYQTFSVTSATTAEPVPAESPALQAPAPTLPPTAVHSPSGQPVAAVADAQALPEPRPRRTSRLPVPVIAALLAVVALVIAGFMLWPRLFPSLPTSANMVNIPAGSFTVGLGNGGALYAPTQQVTLESFWLDRHEVTNQQYAEFLADTRAAAPTSWSGGNLPPSREEHPVQGVTWSTARDYCKWANKRLPTEAEWEVAARGPQSLLFPWGDSQDTVVLPQNDTYPVGSIPANRSAYDLLDMAGNVWEWVDKPYAQLPAGHSVLRGGASGLLKDMAYRLHGNPDVPTMYATAGIRCAASEVEIVPDPAILLEDDFVNPESGWDSVDDGKSITGYHPPDYYHVQASLPDTIATSFLGGNFDNITLETTVFADAWDTANGDFRYGPVLRQNGDSYFAFTISPRTNKWYVLKSSDTGIETRRQGTVEGLRGMDGLGETDDLRVDANGSNFAFSINGRMVAQFTDTDYSAGDVGFFVQTFDEERAHIHFDSLQIRVAEYGPVANIMLQDEFTDPATGWPVISEGDTLSGYHPPDYYHVQAGVKNHLSEAFYSQEFNDFTMEADAFVDSTETPDGDFEYGLGIRQNGQHYLAFMLSPQTGFWHVYKNNQGEQQILAEGTDQAAQGMARTNQLRVDALGSDFIFHINGETLVKVSDSEFSSGNVGFVVETHDQPRAHVHYDRVTVRTVEADLEAAPESALVSAATETMPTETPAEPVASPTVVLEQTTPEPTPAPSLPSSVGMVRVDGSTYALSNNTSVELPEFWLDQFEVTNAQFAVFLAQEGGEPPSYWAEDNIPTEAADHPVREVDWDTAEAYCSWVNKRLPSEAEWEVGARGPFGWLYPWGNEPNAVTLPASGTYAVGSLPVNRTYFGAFDMAGNVWEWIGEPFTPVAAGNHVLRGGANDFQNDMVFRLAGDPANSNMSSEAGFRCAASGVDLQESESVLLDDEFGDLGSGWWQARTPVGSFFYGYHPTDYYHVQVSAPDDCLIVNHELELADYMVEARTYVAKTSDTEGANYRYGIILRESDQSFYALAISPVTKSWQVLKSSAVGMAQMAEGTSETLQGNIEGFSDRLFVIANGPELIFFINGELVSRINDGDYASGYLGFIVETFDETYAHIHYDSLVIWELPPGVAPAATESPSGNFPITGPQCRGFVLAEDVLVNFTSHTVSEGENLSDIAEQYQVTVAEILQANGKSIDNPNAIRAGQTIVIPQS